MRVYLTGFMGSGKSVLGRELAKELSCGFVDLDEVIAIGRGRSISQIFEEAGEESFRKAEREELRKTIRLQDHVIALGGGALLEDGAMLWARSIGFVVFVDVAEDEIVRRLLDSGAGRPLVADALAGEEPEAALRARIREMMERRRPVYEQADVIFRPEGKSVRGDAGELARLLRSRTGHLARRWTGD